MHSTIHAVCGQQKGQNRAKSHVWLIYIFFFLSKGQGVISAFSKGQGVTKRGQGAAPCKRSLGRTLGMTTPNCLSQIYVLLINVPTSQCSVLPPDVRVVGCRWRQLSVPGNASTVGRRSRSDRHHRRLDWVHEQRDNHCLAAPDTRRAGTSIDPVKEFEEEDYLGPTIASAGLGHYKIILGTFRVQWACLIDLRGKLNNRIGLCRRKKAVGASIYKIFVSK